MTLTTDFPKAGSKAYDLKTGHHPATTTETTMTLASATNADSAFADAQRIYTEEFYFQFEKKVGSQDKLLALTRGKPRGEVVFIIGKFYDELAHEGSAAAAILSLAHRFLFNQGAMLEALEAEEVDDSDS